MLPKFKDELLLENAMTHRSALNENVSQSNRSNERLEFLGDAVLELATTNFLYEEYPHEPEGVLTAYRSALVKTTTLAEVAAELNLGEKLYLSKGEEATGGRTNPVILADTTEALIGALYLDQGYEAVKKFLEQFLFGKFEQIKKDKSYRDAKSLLQETVQSQGHPAPVYQVLEEDGPDHDKQFKVEVLVSDKSAGTGSGKSKQAAQQEAASAALKKFSAT